MHPNPAAPRRRVSPADFPALSRGSAAPTFGPALDEALAPKDNRRINGAGGQDATVRSGGRQAPGGSSIGPSRRPKDDFEKKLLFERNDFVEKKNLFEKGFFDIIAKETAVGRTTRAVAGLRGGAVAALVSALALGGAWLCKWSQRHGTNENGA